MNQKGLNILTICLTIVLWGLQMLPDEPSNVFVQWTKDNLYTIACAAGGIVVLLHGIDIFSGRERNVKIWLEKFLKHILDEHLLGEQYQVRISIMKVEPGYKLFLKSFSYFIVKNFFDNIKNSTWNNAWKSVAVHLMSEYLTVYVRYGYPKGKRSHVYFRLSDKSNRWRFNGIADRCYSEGLAQKVHTVDISGIDVSRPLAELSAKEQQNVKKYMKACFFDTTCYDSLRLMHRISNNLYAVPVALSDQSIWGVVIIDNISENANNFETELEKFMPSYMKIISLSLSSLKKI